MKRILLYNFTYPVLVIIYNNQESEMKTMQNISLEEVRTFIAEVERTKRYNRKKIAEYHDRIFGKDDRPRPDDPCPIMQMRQIKAWYQDQKKR